MSQQQENSGIEELPPTGNVANEGTANETDARLSTSSNTLLGNQQIDLDVIQQNSSGEAAIRMVLSDITERSETILRSSSDDTTPSNTGRPPLAPPPIQQAPQVNVLPRPPAISDTGRIQSAPHVSRPPAVTDHSRMQSTGEYSFMSALTDSSGEGIPRDGGNPRQSRNRTVSWDQNFFDGVRSPPLGNIMQPVLHEESHLFDDQRPPDTRTSGNHKRTKTLDLAHLKADNPLETEAESAIIAAIEEESRMEENRRRADSASVVLPHVPNEGLDMFEAESADSKHPTSPLSNSTHSQQQEEPKSPHSAATASNGHRHRRTKSTMPPEGFKMDQNDTLEDTLSGLATAMRKIHTETSDKVDESEKKANHRRLPSRDIGLPTAVLEDIPVNNADILVHNANKLLRRNVRKDESSDDGSSTKAEPAMEPTHEAKQRPIWNVFETKPDPKKTDGDHLDQVEEVSGESSDEEETPEIESSDDESSQSSASADEMATAAGDIEKGISVGDDDKPQRPTIDAGVSQNNRKRTKRFKKMRRKLRRSRKRLGLHFEMFADFLRPKRAQIVMFCRGVVLTLVPLSGVAAILFYLTGNPLMAKNGASVSWLLLFIARQIVTFSMAEASSLFLIDWLSLRTRWTVRVFGPTMALFIVQSKGFPFIMTMWSIFDFMLLSGSHRLANNWMFWQDLIAMCNEQNPSGDIPSSSTNYRVLGSILGAGIAISVKRFWVGLFLGRRTFAHYGDQLAKVIENMILISEVASLGRDFESGTRYSQPKLEKSLSGWDYDDMRSVEEKSGGDKPALNRPSLLRPVDRNVSAGIAADRVIDEGHRNKFTGTLSPSQRIKISQLLDHWEEPETPQSRDTGASINAILQFRQALTFMDNSYPFSLAFGPAENREASVESAQKVYERLMIRNPNSDRLPFDTIAVVAVNKEGEVDQKKMKNLIRIFRPNRDGDLSMLDFVRCCDTVYKSLRLLRASISNSGQIDHAFEQLINYAFYVVLICIILAANGFNPLALFLSFSSIILAFAFMIGSASSKYFEGILFILVRRPYDIGNRIAIADPNSEQNINGTHTWYVQKVDLFTTTVRFSATNEVATLANGSLAASRIVNAARSPKAVVHVYLKLGVDIPYARVQVFKKTVETFIKQRPREWVALMRFRATRVEADLGYIEYALDLQHRESWQNMAAILMSKADLASFCLEVSKQLEMRYQAPSLPVDLSIKDTGKLQQLKDATSHATSQNDSQPAGGGKESSVFSSASPDVQAISALFERR